MNALLLLLTLIAWVAIYVAAKDIYRIKRYGYVKREHIRSK